MTESILLTGTGFSIFVGAIDSQRSILNCFIKDLLYIYIFIIHILLYMGSAKVPYVAL